MSAPLDISSMPVPATPPDKGFKLFRSGEPYHMNAWLNSGMGAIGYAEGYLQAANALMAEVEHGRGLPDFLVYPIVFLYRQHIELQLKDLIWRLKEAGVYKQGVPYIHDVHEIWLGMKKPLVAHCNLGKSENDNLRRVDEFLRQITDMDKGSYAFRYHLDTDGAPSLPGVEQINLVLLRDDLKWLIEWLARTSAYIYQLREWQQEADSASY